MTVTCTLFSVTEEDMQSPEDVSLVAIDDRTSKIGTTRAPHVVELGTAWRALHDALGAYPGDHPLGFLDAGGEPFAPLDDGAASSGRYFGVAQTVKLLAAIARVTDDRLMRTVSAKQLTALGVGELMRKLGKLRVFLAEAVEQDRGVIVHTMSAA